MVKVISPYGIPGVPPSDRIVSLREQQALQRRILFAGKIKELITSVSGVTEAEITSQIRRTPHRIAVVRFIMSHHLYTDAGCSLKEIGRLMRPERPLDHASVIYYNKKFRDLRAIKDPGFMVLLSAFLLEYQSILDSFTTINPTTT